MSTMGEFENLWHDVELRSSTAVRLAEWAHSKDHSYTLLFRILGYEDGPTAVNFTEEDRNKCKALLGPNGYAIFKMLCIKQGLTELCITPTDG